MRKVYLLLLTLLVSGLNTNVFAQFSIGAGWTMINHAYKYTYDSDQTMEEYTQTYHGFSITVMYDCSVASGKWGNVILQPGMMYSMFTKKFSTVYTYNEQLIDLPISLKYSYEFQPDVFGVYLFAGPVLSFGIHAKETYRMVVPPEESEEGRYYIRTVRQNLYNGEIIYKRLYLNGDKITARYNPGLLDPIRNDMSDVRMKKFDLKIGVGIGLTIIDVIDLRFGYNVGMLKIWDGTFEDGEDTVHESMKSDVLYCGLAFRF